MHETRCFRLTRARVTRTLPARLETRRKGEHMANLSRRPGLHDQTQAWEPLRALQDLFRWDPFGEMLGSRGAGFFPNIEVRETKDAFVIEADLPGVQENDLDVSVTGNRLTISG